MAIYVYIATSLDGYIATEDHGIDWLMSYTDPEESDFEAFISKIDALVMGRNSFEKVLTFGTWPYTKKVFVLSNALKEVPEHLEGKVEIISGEIRTVVANLADQGYHNLYIDGGNVVQSFLNEGLVDEMTITRVPTILGGGIPLFGKLAAPIKFNTVTTQVLTPHLVQSHYSDPE